MKGDLPGADKKSMTQRITMIEHDLTRIVQEETGEAHTVEIIFTPLLKAKKR